mmetsp:Transcript_38835/g.59035  ORF Transcript_38835/g.59035 Transcript_38835/m.59035 type:complete len:114 (-) Transcript_38835:1241-1582(-)
MGSTVKPSRKRSEFTFRTGGNESEMNSQMIEGRNNSTEDLISNHSISDMSTPNIRKIPSMMSTRIKKDSNTSLYFTQMFGKKTQEKNAATEMERMFPRQASPLNGKVYMNDQG